MGCDVEIYYRYHQANVHKTNDYQIIKRNIESQIQRCLLKKLVLHHERSCTPPRMELC